MAVRSMTVRRRAALLAAVLAVLAVLFILARHDRDPTATTTTSTGAVAPRPPNRPDPVLTPGAVFATATTQKICVPGYPATVRDVPARVRKQVFASYGITVHPTGAYEVDHLIALELGGSNDITNLWPEPYAGPENAHDKDVLENRLHRQVCAGTLTLIEAQTRIVTWWNFD